MKGANNILGLSALQQLYKVHCHTFQYNNLLNRIPREQRQGGLTLSQLMLHICRVSKTFGEWYQKTHKTDDTNKVNLFVSSVLFSGTIHLTF
jgi:hypothetical protein